MPHLVDITLSLFLASPPPALAYGAGRKGVSDAFALWAGEWLDLLHSMGFLVEVPPSLRHAAPAGPRARKPGAPPHGHYARLGGCCDALRDFPAFWARYAPLKDRIEFCPTDTAGCATALAVLWLSHGGARVAGALGGSAAHGPAAGPALEEAALCLAAQGQDAGLRRLDLLPRAATLLREAGLTLSRHKAVLGADIFAVESGIHVDGIAKAPHLYEPFSPESVGLTRQVVMGRHSGLGAVRLKARQMGLPLPEAALRPVLGAVHALALRQQSSLCDAQFAALCRPHLPPAIAQPRRLTAPGAPAEVDRA